MKGETTHCRNPHTGGIKLLIAIICAATIYAISSPPEIEAATLRVISPPDNSWVTEKTLFLAGQTDKAIKQVTIQGVKTATEKISADGGAFGAMITLQNGLNTIIINDGKTKKTTKVFYTPTSKKKTVIPKGFKRFYIHQKPTVLNCKECHRLKRGAFNFKRVIPARANCTSGQCHSDKGKAPHVHGPVGAGFCISCHSPHGSFK
ncbi:MAG: hypothetical protein OEL55_04965, partial [Desulfobulbaceae bacterium]|nr:hypothetical protein [Desulfobulbaceae bacterium]